MWLTASIRQWTANHRGAVWGFKAGYRENITRVHPEMIIV